MNHAPLFDLLEVRGPDALAFLQAQLAADLNSLADAGWRWSALLNAQGRVLHVLGVWRVAADHWRLLVPFARGEELGASLRRMVFRRKVRIEVDASRTLGRDAEGVDCDVAGMRVSLVAREDARALAAEALDDFARAGLALIDVTASGRQLAHSLQIDRFAAFSVGKGCYPGQEIVARTHFLGRNKRSLVLLEATPCAAWKSVDAVFDAGAELGEIVLAGRSLALAVIAGVPSTSRLQVGAGGIDSAVLRLYAPVT
ncbi:MAG: hypothetical protein IPG63_16345 [Xanthomonadales bacterium]|nr:hypothetical protein [Xanthomonadales bacterium]MBK7147104.1 hypothetical protein [Xanthomonadales bacterium]MCC6562942.1 hypothetical protein [Xanthomonadales bacterium]